MCGEEIVLAMLASKVAKFVFNNNRWREVSPVIWIFYSAFRGQQEQRHPRPLSVKNRQTDIQRVRQDKTDGVMNPTHNAKCDAPDTKGALPSYGIQHQRRT